MESSYKEIYKLQDDILDLVFSRDAPWYLTGGTALSRFYFSHRYSDDLDFFSLETISFAENFREEKEKLIRVWPQSDAQIDSRDFKRIEVRHGPISVKLDFVCDRTARIGRPELRGTRKIDTVRNILSNKLGTILGRDEPRDVADILTVCRNRHFLWKTIVEEAQKKEGLTLEDLLYRAKTFPLEWLDRVPFYVPRNPEKDALDWTAVIQDLSELGPNSLAGPDCDEI